jgi:hypothetical protein
VVYRRVDSDRVVLVGLWVFHALNIARAPALAAGTSRVEH